MLEGQKFEERLQELRYQNKWFRYLAIFFAAIGLAWVVGIFVPELWFITELMGETGHIISLYLFVSCNFLFATRTIYAPEFGGVPVFKKLIFTWFTIVCWAWIFGFFR